MHNFTGSEKTPVAKVGISPNYNGFLGHKNLCFWSGTILGNDNYQLNFYVNNTGYLYTRYGQIGNWYIGNGGLYSDGDNYSSITEYGRTYTWDGKTNTWIPKIDKTKQKTRGVAQLIKGKDYNYTTSSDGIYLGSDGIRFGSTFHVDPIGGLYAIAGTIGGINITQDGLHSTNWNIDGAGVAHFSNAYINGSSINDAKSISGSTGGGGISGGGMCMGSGGAGSSYMNPGVRTSPDGQTWEDYIKEAIENALTRDKIINALQDGNYTINFGDY